MYDDFESGAWHDKNNTIHNLEKKNDFDTSDKNKNIENKNYPPPILPCPP